VGNNFELWLDTDDDGAAPVDPATVFLSKSGGAMSGPLLLADDPQAAKEAATRAYVDRHRTGRNMLINGSLAVTQRKASIAGGAPGSAWLADRWKCVLGGTNTNTGASWQPIGLGAGGSMPQSLRGYLLFSTASHVGSDDYIALNYRIEDVRQLMGKTVTLSFWGFTDGQTHKVGADLAIVFDSSTPARTIAARKDVTILSGSPERYSMTWDIPGFQTGDTLGNNAYVELRFFTHRTGWFGVQNGNVRLAGLQLEEGAEPTAFEDRPYADELRDCQRYYYKTPPGQYVTMLMTAYNSGNALGTPAYFPERMRIAPQIAFWDQAGTVGKVTHGENLGVSNNGVAPPAYTEIHPEFWSFTAGGIGTGQPGFIRLGYEASAEL
jgi:hypothetical protein